MKKFNNDTLIKKCLINEDCIATQPFKQENVQQCYVMRHKSNNKWYALIFDLNNELCINLKCPPDLIAILKEQYKAIKPAWHMNKKHWCTVEVNKIPQSTLDELIKISFEITAPKRNPKRPD